MSTRTRQAAATESFDLPNEAHALEVSTTYPLSEPASHARARMGRYARIQAKDFLMRQGAAMVIIALALAIPMFSVARNSPQPFARVLEQIYAVVAMAVAVIGTLVATRGIVSEDIQHGFHRFLFSKPLNVERYYAQSLAIRFAGFLALLFVILLPFTLLGAVPLVQTMALAALFFTLVGGVGFLLSTFTRIDTGLLLGVGVLTMFVQAVSQLPGYAWLKVLGVLLPPLAQLGTIAEYLIANNPARAFPVGSILWVLGYGAASVAAGLAVLRRRAVTA